METDADDEIWMRSIVVGGVDICKLLVYPFFMSCS